MKVGFIGSGNMASALISSMSKNDNYEISVMDINEEALKKNEKLVSFTSTDVKEVIARSEYLILAIKPYMYQDFLIEHKEILQDKLVVSIAAGISKEFMKTYLNKYVIVMPNTPAAVGLGLTSIVENDDIDKQEFLNVVQIFETVGETKIITEDQLSNMICLAGSSPAYFYLVLEAMSKFGQAKGMDKKEAIRVVANVMKATAQMQLDSELSPRELADNVCSPNGTTIEAVEYFDEHGLEELFYKAMEACYDRSLEMKRENDESL
ncbi:pyrroline-5-carboxylate reductase [Bacilli bacterium PM5-3]|nr:pyrroline-5-carboxylate reductase [Bacilli bacterium PM5-3]MDH6603539.1 pyrroline-5-carboxylate reductase [Bacilli bacterium PM5-9]